MRKTQVTYLVMMLIFAAGLWAILRIGTHLRAARNLAGEWQVAESSSELTPPGRLSLHQSGKFLTGTLRSRGKEIRLSGELEESQFTLRAARPPLTVTGMLNDGGDRLSGRFDGLICANWSATRPTGVSAAR
jgi:hypothetical protein